jgi:exopolyphosphatase/guanosine-5'-triphosphate,3'-diphosphate pyrophosphatase
VAKPCLEAGFNAYPLIALVLRRPDPKSRIRDLGLKPDRADVIVPAARIYLAVLDWMKIGKLHVPQIGLADGLIHLLYEKQKREALNF